MTLNEFYEGGDEDRQRRSRSAPRRLLSNAAHLYGLRVREQPFQEFLAVIGIAAGVALLFAVQVSSSSMSGAVQEIAHSVSGKATLEVAGRGPDGLDQEMVAKAQALSIVDAAAPVVMKRVTVEGSRSDRPVVLVGVDDRLEKMEGLLVRQFRVRRGEIGLLGLHLSTNMARDIGASVGDRLTINSDGRRSEVLLAGLLNGNDIGAVAQSPVAIAPLGQVQRVAGMQGRVSRILIAPKHDSEGAATRQLHRLFGDQFNVRPSDAEVVLLAEALKPDEQSSSMFSAIAVVIGMLFAYNAMILGAVRRRRQVALLRLVGADRSTVLSTLIFEAIVLGLVASLLGIALGDLISRIAFEPLPGFIASGFPIGTQRVVTTTTILIALLGGLAAAFLASTKPALELYRVRPGEGIGERLTLEPDRGKFGLSVFWTGLVVLLGTSVALFVEPRLTPVAIPALIIGIVLMLGPILGLALHSLGRITRVRGGVGVSLAIDELAGNRWRSTALAVIVVGSLTAILSIGGASLDLERGENRLDREFFQSEEFWISPRNESNLFFTESFDGGSLISRVHELDEVRDAEPIYGAFLDIGDRRMRVVAKSSDDAELIAASQVVRGDRATANERIRRGGWIAVTDSFAKDNDVDIGGNLGIPTPAGLRQFQVAAIISNYGWPSGAMVMNASDFRSAWKTERVGAIAVDLAPYVSEAQGRQTIQNAVGSRSTLRVNTASEMIEERRRALGQGLAKIHQISVLVLITSVLAIVAAMFAAVWQRRERLAALRAIGMYRTELFRSLLAETTLVVALSGIVGVALGAYCQFFASRWTEISSGYRSPFEPAFALGLSVFLQVVVLTILATAVPALVASRVPPCAQPDA